jgi:hypothetical protein
MPYHSDEHLVINLKIVIVVGHKHRAFYSLPWACRECIVKHGRFNLHTVMGLLRGKARYTGRGKELEAVNWVIIRLFSATLHHYLLFFPVILLPSLFGTIGTLVV